MQTDEQLKEIVRNKYSEIALQDKETNMSSCCGAGGCSTEVYNIMSEDYTTLDGYTADADLGFENVTIQKEKAIVIPDDILVNYLSASEITAFKSGSTGIMSITVFAQKPLENKTACVPGGGCC